MDDTKLLPVEPNSEVFKGQYKEVDGFRIGVCTDRTGRSATYIAFPDSVTGWVTFIFDQERAEAVQKSMGEAVQIVASRNKTKAN